MLADLYGPGNFANHIVAAESAILALREPSLDMLDAAMPHVSDWGYLPDQWRVMIDFAAKDRGT